MSLNPNKCKIISFHRNIQPIEFQYMVDTTYLERVTSIRDLGVVLSSDLSPDLHVDEICRRGHKTMGLLCRISRDPFSTKTLLSFYCSYIRQQLEYCSVIWSPYLLGQCDRLESIQRRFARLVGTKLGFGYLESPVPDILTDLGLTPLKLRREVADISFLHKLLTGAIICEELLEQIEFRIPNRTRSRELFYKRSYPYNTLLFPD